MAYKIAYKSSAEKYFSKLSKETQRRIFSAVETLAENPRLSGAIKLQSPYDLYRIRVGDYRIVYSIDDNQLKILVVTLGHRRDVYRNV